MTKPEPLHPVQWECSTGTKRKAIYKGESITCERIDSGWIGYYRATTVILNPDLSSDEHGSYYSGWYPQEGWPPRPLPEAREAKNWLVQLILAVLIVANFLILGIYFTLVFKRG